MILFLKLRFSFLFLIINLSKVEIFLVYNLLVWIGIVVGKFKGLIIVMLFYCIFLFGWVYL